MLLRLVLCNDVRIEFTIHVQNNVLIAYYLAGCTSPEDTSSNWSKLVLRNGSNFVPNILFEFAFHKVTVNKFSLYQALFHNGHTIVL